MIVLGKANQRQERGETKQQNRAADNQALDDPVFRPRLHGMPGYFAHISLLPLFILIMMPKNILIEYGRLKDSLGLDYGNAAIPDGPMSTEKSPPTVLKVQLYPVPSGPGKMLKADLAE